MSIYEEEMFKYITKVENFEVAFEISELFPDVTKKVIAQFWGQVKNKLIESTNNTHWVVSLDDDVFSTWSSLNLTREKWKESFYVMYEKLHENVYYGLWINYEHNDLDMNRIVRHVENIESLYDMKKSKYWLGYTHIGEDFNSINTLKKILPSRNNDLADELAKLLFDFAEEIKPEVDVMNGMRIKS